MKALDYNRAKTAPLAPSRPHMMYTIGRNGQPQGMAALKSRKSMIPTYPPVTKALPMPKGS